MERQIMDDREEYPEKVPQDGLKHGEGRRGDC